MPQIKAFQLDIDEELSLSGDPITALGAAPKQYVVAKSGDTMTGNLIINADATVNNLTIVNTLDMGTF